MPVGYHQYLTNLYGDYMVIPQNEADRSHTHLDRWTVEIDEDFDFSKMHETIGTQNDEKVLTGRSN